MSLTKDKLVQRCRQLDIDSQVAISAAESAKKELDEISKKTWQNIITIISKNLKKDQTPDQAFEELIGTGQLSKEVLQDLATGSAGLDVVENIEKWFGIYLYTGAGLGSMVTIIGLGAYVKFFARPGLEAAQAAHQAANVALAALQNRAQYAGRLLGQNVAAQAVPRQIILTNEALAAANRELLFANRIANAGKWTNRVAKLGMWACVISLSVVCAAELYKSHADSNTRDELKHSLHEIYTGRFYMTMQQKYLEYLVNHIGEIEVYTALIMKGEVDAAATVLEKMTSHAVEIDPETNQVKPDSIKPDSWSEEAVIAYLAKLDEENKQKTDDDPNKEERLKIHEEQLKKIQEMMNKDLEEAKAQAAAAKQN